MQGHEARPLIAITMGDPAGIGAEVSLKALLEPAVYAMCRPLVMFANYSDNLCSFLRPRLAPHPAFGTPFPNGRGDRG